MGKRGWFFLLLALACSWVGAERFLSSLPSASPEHSDIARHPALIRRRSAHRPSLHTLFGLLPGPELSPIWDKGDTIAAATKALEQCRFREARALLKEAVENFPESYEAHLGLAEYYYLTRQPSAALEEALASAKLLDQESPRRARVLFLAGKLRGVYRAGQSTADEAARFFLEANRLDPEDFEIRRVAVRSLGSLPGSLEKLEAKEKEGPQTFDRIFSGPGVLRGSWVAGEMYFAGGNYAKAASILSQIVESDPRNVQARFTLAKALSRIDKRGAEREFAALVEDNDELSVTDQIELARFFVEKRPEAALSLLEKNRERCPDYPGANILLSYALASRGDLHSALEAATRETVEHPYEMVAWLQKARIHDLAGDSEKAIDALEEIANAWDRATADLPRSAWRGGSEAVWLYDLQVVRLGLERLARAYEGRPLDRARVLAKLQQVPQNGFKR